MGDPPESRIPLTFPSAPIDIRKILHELSELHNVTRTTEDKTVDLNVTESGLQ